MLKLADFGLHELRASAEPDPGSHDKNKDKNKLWWPPELLRDTDKAFPKGTQKGDVYAFGIILYEIYGRNGPYGEELSQTTPLDIIKKVALLDTPPKRPDIQLMRESADHLDTVIPDYIITLMQECWSEDPNLRPDFVVIRNRLKPMRLGMKNNIMDQGCISLHCYMNVFEDDRRV